MNGFGQWNSITRAQEATDAVLHDTFESIPGKTWVEKLNEVNRCECCPRHMTNRPAKLEPWVELPWSSSRTFYPNGIVFPCVCKCRHNARFICRQVCEDPSECPKGSPRGVEVETVLTPGERRAWLEHLDEQEIEAAMETLTTN